MDYTGNGLYLLLPWSICYRPIYRLIAFQNFGSSFSTRAAISLLQSFTSFIIQQKEILNSNVCHGFAFSSDSEGKRASFCSTVNAFC